MKYKATDLKGRTSLGRRWETMRFQACVYTIISELPRYTSQGKGVVCALSVECVHVFVCVCFFWRAQCVCVCVSLCVCV